MAFVASPLWAAGKDSSCITCHRTVSGVKYLEHDFADWEHSVHAKAGISCDACHGGNAAETDAAKAHQGMKPSTDPTSPVYFTKIPATCGTCHQAEYKAFQKSAHFEELQRTGRGPNCVSCHGSMANHILAPRDMELSCSLCHKKPTQAVGTLLALNNAANSVARLDKALEEVRGKHVEASRQEQEYKELQALEMRAREDWHTFNMKQVLATSQDITKRANVAMNELKLKEQQQKP